MTSTYLHAVSEHVFMWAPQSAGWGLANCGLVTSPRGTTAWIDSPYDTVMAARFRDEAQRVLPGSELPEWLLVTHGNGDHLWGAPAVPSAKIIYTSETAGHIEHEPSPAQLHALVHNSDPDSPLGWYLRRHFGRYDWTTAEIRQPTITFTGQLEISVGGTPVQLTQLAPAHTTGDMMAYLPTERVAFSGDVIFASSPEHPGDHPVHWSGPLANVIDGCRRVLDTGAVFIVPGHGPLLDREGVHGHIAYLEHMRQRCHTLHAAGVPLREAATRIIAENRYPDLHLRERLLVTLGAEYRHLDSAPPAPMLDQVTAMAALAWELEHDGIPAPRTGSAAIPVSQ
jgi:cyclase